MTQGFESFLDTVQYIYTIILGENQGIFTRNMNNLWYGFYSDDNSYVRYEVENDFLEICDLFENISSENLVIINNSVID